MNVQTALLAVEETMSRVVASDVAVLQEASRHILQAGGKRLRPRLALHSYLAVGGQDLKVMVPIAAAMEILHTATLVHDDINDHGTMRRSRPTVNAIWGRTFALLTGDYLFTKVYELMAPYGALNAVFAEATVKLVEGETLQAQAAKDGALDQDLYFEIIARKTAALFTAAAKLGAMAGGGTVEQVNALGGCAHNMGLAFQIVDDLLDLLADADQLGKTAGLDIAQGKGIAVAARKAAGNGARVAIPEIDERDSLRAFSPDALQTDFVQRARNRAYELVSEGVAMLHVLPPSPALEALQAMAWQMVERDH